MSKKPYKKKLKKKEKDMNYAPRRAFIFITFVLAFINFVSALGASYWFYLNLSGREIPEQIQSFDRLTGFLFILIFLGYFVGLVGILRPLPPLHFAAIFASLINLIISLILIYSGSSGGPIQGMLSAIHLYLGLRFPLDFALSERTLAR